MTKYALPDFEKSLFLEGPFGSGKTTAAAWKLVDFVGEYSPDRILVIVPQPDNAKPYQAVLMAHDVGLYPEITTFSGFARRMLRLFWPLIAEALKPDEHPSEPAFLTMETAQYFMSRFARPYIEMGKFDSIYLPEARLVAQILDNMNKAATGGYTLEQAHERLVRVWGDRQSNRLMVYDTIYQISQQYRAFCISHNLFDYGLQVELFTRYLLQQPLFESYFQTHHHIMVADNIEEMGAVAHNFLTWSQPYLDQQILLFDQDAGYRAFLGADPDSAYELAGLCEQHVTWGDGDWRENTGTIGNIQSLFWSEVQPDTAANQADDIIVLDSVYYPQMLERCVSTICHLIYDLQVSPEEIVILTPYLNDSLRYTLQSHLKDNNIVTHSYRPSRSLYSEPVVRAILTCVYLSHPQWQNMITAEDVTDALLQLIDGLDPIRAALLARITVRNGQLSSFRDINTQMQTRIGAEAGDRFEILRQWLLEHATHTMPLDHYLRRLFGQVLAQPGYGFHSRYDSARLAGELIQAAQAFRWIAYPDDRQDWTDPAYEFCTLIENGLITSQTLLEEPGGILLMPVYAFLIRNQAVDYQFWLDVGNRGWWERLDQPLTHPYALRQTYPGNAVWTDEMEVQAQQIVLHNVITGLLRRCRKTAYIGVSALGETGYELSGPLINLFQRLLGLAEVDDNGE